MSIRQWVALKLVRLAYRLHNPEYYERIHVNGPDGALLFEAIIAADEYGSGVSFMFGGHGEALPDGSTVHWDDDYNWPED